MTLPIQNIRSNTANKRPVASNLLDGQIAINYNENDPGVYLKGHSGALIKVAPTYVSSSAPNSSPASGGSTGNSKGETWLDTSSTPAILKTWNGTAFVDAGGFTDIHLSGRYKQAVIAVSGTAIDCSAGNYFTKTVSSATTFSFSNVPNYCAYSLVIEITHTGGSIQWPSSVKFPGGNAPNLTTGKTHLFMFVTDDGGSRFRGAFLEDFDN
jgi:hypothetical protein